MRTRCAARAAKQVKPCCLLVARVLGIHRAVQSKDDSSCVLLLSGDCSLSSGFCMANQVHGGGAAYGGGVGE
jgi:hypothetical protein